MVKSRRKFDKEFKLMAIELIETHKSVKQVSEELGVEKALLYQWRTAFRKKGKESFNGNGKVSLTTEESEIARLKKELKEVEMERDILKKAVSIFSKNDGKNTNL